MARLRVAPHEIEAVLNHVSGVISGVAGIYNRHAYIDEKRAALATWAAHLDALEAVQKISLTGIHAEKYMLSYRFPYTVFADLSAP